MYNKSKPKQWVSGLQVSTIITINQKKTIDYCCSFQFPYHWEYDALSYREATTKEELCKTRRVPLVADSKETKNFEAHCLKARSNNIFLCPEKIRRGKRNKLIEFLNNKISKHACCKTKSKKNAKNKQN